MTQVKFTTYNNPTLNTTCINKTRRRTYSELALALFAPAQRTISNERQQRQKMSLKEGEFVRLTFRTKLSLQHIKSILIVHRYHILFEMELGEEKYD